MHKESLSNVLGGTEFTSLLGVLPFISAFVIFMMTHDYIQEILQLEFQTQNSTSCGGVSFTPSINVVDGSACRLMGLIFSVLPLFLAFLIRTPTRPVVTSNVETITLLSSIVFRPKTVSCCQLLLTCFAFGCSLF